MRKNISAALIILAILAGYAWRQESKRPPAPVSTNKETTIVTLGRIGEGYFNFELADTRFKRTQGLSGRKQLPPTDAMLFVFGTEDEHCFWMKDMQFAIDILWFDANKRLVYEQRNVSPDTYPQSFCSTVPTKYVAEMTAGTADKNQLQIGQALDVEL